MFEVLEYEMSDTRSSIYPKPSFTLFNKNVIYIDILRMFGIDNLTMSIGNDLDSCHYLRIDSINNDKESQI